jgi:hypothetical protein
MTDHDWLLMAFAMTWVQGFMAGAWFQERLTARKDASKSITRGLA